MEQFRAPSPLSLTANPADNWCSWEQSFRRYIAASGEKDEKAKIDILLHTIGEDALELYNTLTVRGEGDELTMEDVLQAFKDHCCPQRNVVFERVQYWSHQRTAGTSVNTFMTELRQKSKHCEFGIIENDMLRDKLVLSITDSDLKKRLIQERRLTLYRAIEICRATEEEKTLLQAIETEHGVQEVPVDSEMKIILPDKSLHHNTSRRSGSQSVPNTDENKKLVMAAFMPKVHLHRLHLQQSSVTNCVFSERKNVEQLLPERLHIKEEPEMISEGQEENQLCVQQETNSAACSVKCEDEEEKPQASQLHWRQITEFNIKEEPSTIQLVESLLQEQSMCRPTSTIESVAIVGEDNQQPGPSGETRRVSRRRISSKPSFSDESESDGFSEPDPDSSDEWLLPGTTWSSRVSSPDALERHEGDCASSRDPTPVGRAKKKARASSRDCGQDSGRYQTDLQPNEIPCTATSGPRNAAAQPDSDVPANFLELFLTDELLQLIVDQTNLYATQYFKARPGSQPHSRGNAWSPVSVAELKTFFGLSFLTGYVKKPSLVLYWSVDEVDATPYFTQTMSRNRFQIIWKFLHYNNNESQDATDKMYKVRPVLDYIMEKVREMYLPGRSICIDEGMMQLQKGQKCKVPQFNPECVVAYNAFMNGVDKLDQNVAYYPYIRRSLNWSKKFVAYLFQICMFNAFVLYKARHHGECKTLLEFMRSVVKSWTAKRHVVKEEEVAGVGTEGGGNLQEGQDTARAPYNSDPDSRLDGQIGRHKLEHLVSTTRKSKPVRRCRVCARKGKRSETRLYCKACCVPLHAGECFTAYHTKLNYSV
ncbi:uncharacterized protein LOC114461463 [Gouania willdenowi]|uniref:Uncharacterized LOC114461463 n=1 Tax=Gouania willdenowi TaxID=441366 RepID=A0A8C5EW13_GOUWI|nr:uncharacterized protein LOC114461463 [Gouania willdenowi]